MTAFEWVLEVAAHPAQSLQEPHGFRPLCYSVILLGGWGKFEEGGQNLILFMCSVLYGTVEPFATGKSITHSVPLLTEFDVTRPPTQLYSVFISTSNGGFGVNISVKQSFACDVTYLMTTVLPCQWHWWWHTVGNDEPTAATGPPKKLVKTW